MSKLKKIKNGEYIGGDKYTITPEASGKSKVVFNPDSVITEPTPVGAEVLNEMQLNGTYTLNTNRIIDGQKEVYIATLEGFTEFDNPDLNLILKINSNNSSNNVYLRLNNIDYQILNCGIGNLISGRFTNAKKEGNFIKLLSLEKTDLTENDSNKLFSAKGAFDLKTYLITNYTTLMNNIRDTLTNSINTKLPHGGYNQSAQTLKNEIDTKVFRNSININTSVDFNNFETSGFYNVYKASGVVFTNAPNSNFDYGTLLVIGQGKAGASFVTQIATRRDTGLTYIRTRNDGSMAWTNWVSMYGTNNKPSKTDVGLSNVPNYPATSSVSDSSDEKLATALAVKKANDNANGRVSKSGDLMTGTLETVRSNETYGINQRSTNQNGSRTNLLRTFRNWFNSTIYHEVVDDEGWKIFTGAELNYPLFEMSQNMERGLRVYNGHRVFHEGYLPSKANVGLGNVPNYPATSSVSDSSDEKLATAGAVKKANDNANGRVSKNGDTINGSLTLNTTANERVIKSSQNWGMYFNSGGIGWFDWANNRSIFGYGASTGSITISAATIMSNTLHQNGLLNFNARRSSDYYMEMLPSGAANPSGSKNLIRKMRGGDGDSIWHEVVQGNTWKLATGNTDSTVQIEVSSGNLAMPGNITSRGNSVVTGIRLGTVVSRSVWMSAQSATEDKGYVTVAVRNSNADDHVDNEYRRPLQVSLNGSWVTVSAI